MPNNLDRLGRAVNNLMTRVFEQGGPPKFNTRMSNTLQSRGEITLIEEAYGIELNNVALARYYSDLIVAGSDTDADAGRYGITGATQRIQYNGGVLAAYPLIGTDRGWFVARIQPNWAAATEPGDKTLLFWGTSSLNRLKFNFRTSDKMWTMNRSGGALTNTAAVAATHAASADITVAGFWSPTQVGVSLASTIATWTTTNSGNYRATLPAALFDIGVADAVNTEIINASIYWLAIGTGTLSAADLSTLNALGNPGPAAWSDFPNFGALQPTFLWPGVDATHLAPAVYGEASYAA